MRIGKKEVKRALAKYSISFDFPNDTKDGETITCWSDLYSRNGDTIKLKAAIRADKTCPFAISRIPANMLASLRLIRK